MSQYTDAGRIHREPFTVSICFLFGLCILSTCARFYIRIRIQKQLFLDDGILLFGVCCMIGAIGVLFAYIDNIFIIQYASYAEIGSKYIPIDLTDRVFEFHKMQNIYQGLAWAAVGSVKLTYITLFHRLINGLERWLKIYWWITLLFNLAAIVYGFFIFYISCPYFDLRIATCIQPEGVRKVVNVLLSHVLLDISGDLMIIVIPIVLIWKIQLEVRQKLGLAATLCLSIVLIIVTALRVPGYRGPDEFYDTAWTQFWPIISPEIGIILTAASAFRALFVPNRRHGNKQKLMLWCSRTSRTPSISSWDKTLAQRWSQHRQTTNVAMQCSPNYDNRRGWNTYQASSLLEARLSNERSLLPQAHLSDHASYSIAHGLPSGPSSRSSIMQV